MIYGFSVRDLIQHDLGFGRPLRQKDWLDIDPPDGILEALSARTRVPVERLKRTTISSLRPFLFAYFDWKYYGHNSVLVEPAQPPPLRLSKWVLRQERENYFNACRSCLQTYPNAGLLLPWRFRIITSYPVHGMMLEPVRIIEDSVRWFNAEAEEAPEMVRLIDLRSWTALTTGSVELPGGIIHAGFWFCLLRTIQDELTRALLLFGSCQQKPIVAVLAAVDQFLHATGRTSWNSRLERKRAIGIATAIDMIEKGAVFPEGLDAWYFSVN